MNSNTVLRVTNCNLLTIKSLLNKFSLKLELTPENQIIPGSYWGDSEAGIISNKLFVRLDTPIHSLLHEACHFICMDNTRRMSLDTNAEGDYDEENGVCYLQILLADDIPEMGRKRMMKDMDSWGYTFRLGSAKQWFEQDSSDTVEWLNQHSLLENNNRSSYTLRQ